MERERRFPIEKVEEFCRQPHPYFDFERSLSESETRFARAYAAFIDFTHNVMVGRYKTARVARLPDEEKEKFRQLKEELEDTKKNLDNPTMELILMADVSSLFQTLVWKALEKQAAVLGF